MIDVIKEKGLENVKFCTFFSTINGDEHLDFYIIDNEYTIIYISKHSKARYGEYGDRVGEKINGYTIYSFKDLITKGSNFTKLFLKELEISPEEYPEYFI